MSTKRGEIHEGRCHISHVNNRVVDEIGECLLRLALLALLVAALLKIVVPEFTRLREELVWGVVPAQAASERDEQTGKQCRDDSLSGRRRGLARRRAVNPRRARRNNAAGMQQSARRQRPLEWRASDYSVQPRGAPAIDERLPPSKH
jgi:hypothetical protein